MLGKEFFKDVNNTVYTNVKFVRKNSANCAIYKKI
ncbi:single-stranded DNA-binding protein [Clostridium algidicarnis]|nr:single-stranded DNA-binding protein [Clostridium algidicarnis]